MEATDGAGDAMITDEANVFNYNAVNPSPTALTQENELESDDDDDEESIGSEIEVNEDGTEARETSPRRKIKKHAAMTPEQQQIALMQLKTALSRYDDIPKPVSLKNAPERVQKASGGVRTQAASAPSPQKGSQKKRKGSSKENEKAKLPTKKQKKQQKREVKPEVKHLLGLFYQLGKAFEKNLMDMSVAAGEILAKEEGNDCPMAELFEMADDWKDENQKRLEKTTAFLGRYGVIPMGGVEATAEGMEKLA